MKLKRKLAVAAAIILLLVFSGIYVLLTQMSPFVGAPFHYPDQNSLKLFGTVSIDGSFGTSLKSAELKIAEKEFSDLILDVCRDALSESRKFNDVAISHLGEEVSFEKHPLNMGILFILVNSSNPQALPKSFELFYQFSRKGPIWGGQYPENKEWPIVQGKPFSGKIHSGNVKNEFILPETGQQQLEAIRLIAKKQCDVLRRELNPEPDYVEEYEAEILKKNK